MVGFVVLAVEDCNFADVMHCDTGCIIIEYRMNGLEDGHPWQENRHHNNNGTGGAAAWALLL